VGAGALAARAAGAAELVDPRPYAPAALARVLARFPALGNEEVALTVTFVAPQGDFATWRSTSAQGGFDLKTFEMRARPVAPVAGLRPGMSAIVTWDRAPE